MATSAPRPSSSSSRRSSSSFNAPTSASIARGATARSAVSHKVNASLNGINRRGSVAKTAPAPVQSEDSAIDNEGFLSALKKETEEKEELLVKIQDKDQSIAELTKENSSLTTTLNAAETRLNELYADQARIEEETVARLDLVDRLRSQVQELEREKRDILRRYNEQTATFDAERQSFYDNEQHLKSRIQSLAQARKASEVNRKVSLDLDMDEAVTPVKEYMEESHQPSESSQPSVTQNLKGNDGEDDEPAEMTALRLELSTLSTSYSSLQTTVQHLSAQLLDLKRVNNQLQEENESYNILLREKTISGQFDILRTVGTGESEEDSGEELQEDDVYGRDEQTSIRSRSRTPLDPVDELAEDMDASVYMDEKNDQMLDEDESGDADSNVDRTRTGGRKGRRAPMVSHSPVRKGESLANLPVAGPGLDLAAELGRAENLAFLEGQPQPSDSRGTIVPSKGKLGKKKSIDQKNLATPPVSAGGDVDALRNEVKSLKDANKALSLYASKIIDRIIAQEGFEHVLAADYEKVPASPVKKTTPPTPKAEAPKKKARPQSAIFGLNFQNLEPASTSSDPPKSPIPQTPVTAIPTEVSATTRTQRRSMSFDWRSMFGGAAEKKPEPNPNLRPLNLRPGAPTVVTARKLDTQEDEEDQKERERLNAVMKLMGIEKPASVPPSPFIGSPSSSTGTPVMISSPPSEATSPRTTAPNRFSFFRSRSNTSETSINSGNGPKSSLTAEALERAEAETSLAALDEREKVLSAEIAKGSNGGFTELPSRRQRNDEKRSWRSKRSGESGSGSTVWSAGMSTHKEESGDEGGAARS